MEDNENNKFHLFDEEAKLLAKEITRDPRTFARFLKKIGDNSVDPQVRHIIIMALNALNQMQ